MDKTDRQAGRRRLLKGCAAAAAAGSYLFSSSPCAAAAATGASPGEAVQVAVITAGHPFDVPSFHRLFRSLRGVNAMIQHLDDFASSPESVRDGYQAVLFYFMMMPTPTDEKLPGYAGKPKAALEHLGETRQGIVVSVDGKKLVDYVEPDDVKGPRKLSRGTFALQAHDPGSTVHYRNIRIRPLPD